MDSLKAMVFGPRSERRPLADAGQGTLDLGDTALCTTAAVVTSDVLADGRLEPDTIIVERSIRPVALGRRNVSVRLRPP